MSDDLIVTLFEYLRPESISRLSVCSKILFSICQKFDRRIWKPHSDVLFTHRTLNVPTKSLLERINDLSPEKRREYAADVKIPNVQEEIRVLMIKALFLFPFGKYPSKENHWQSSLGEWKATYYHSRKECIRRTIMHEELTNICWKFVFKGEVGEVWNAIFLKDFTLHCEFNSIPYRWKVMMPTIIMHLTSFMLNYLGSMWGIIRCRWSSIPHFDPLVFLTGAGCWRIYM